MIIKLIEGRLEIKLMSIPELTTYLFIQYEYEGNTNHLTPHLWINHKEYIGDRLFIEAEFDQPQLDMKVELLDGNKKILRTYTGQILYNKYAIYGKKPIRPDIEVYVHQLEKTIESLQATIEEMKIQHQLEIDILKSQHQLEIDKLNQVIKELEERGEVV